MAGFEHVETAAAIREIMGALTEKKIQEIIPSSNYGRVISVNTTSLSATVWFPGDESPVSVNMFPNLVPAAWHELLGPVSGAGVTNTSYYGYGSQVEVRDFNGKKYITQVLTDAVLWPEARLMSPTLVAQVATEVAADQAGMPQQLVGEQYETFINCSISNASLSDGGSISFGPFTTKNDALPGIGWIEMTVTELNGSTKYFKFPVNPPQDFQHTGGSSFLDDWFRIIPEQQICNPNPSQIVDFDVDVAIKRTVYGLKDEFTPSEEVWFRVVKRGNGWTGFYGQVTIRATNIQKGRSLSGRKLFMQETSISPSPHKGYLGFHNAQHIYRDIDDYGIVDGFGRVIANQGTTGPGWGTSDSGPTWNPVAGGGFGADGQWGYIAPTANYVSYITLSSGSIESPDMYWDAYISALPTGAEVQHGFLARYIDTSNMNILKGNFNTAGNITLSFVTVIAGASTVIGSDLVVPGLTFAANTRIRFRARVNGNVFFMKAWNPSLTREPDWQRIQIGAAFNTPASTHKVGFMVQPGGANSNTKPITVGFDNVRAALYVKGQDNTGRQWHTGPWRSGVLRLADSLQKTWTIDGKFLWDGTNFGWGSNQYIRFGGVGQHRNGLAAASGILQLPPTSATGFSIPVVPNGTARSVGSSGVQLDAGQSLWCAIPPGQNWENMYEYLFIVDNTAAVDYDLPEWAVMIAMRCDTGAGVNGPEIRTGDGGFMDKWRPMAGGFFTPNWSDFGSPLDVSGYRWDAPGVVRFKGLIKHTTTNQTGTFFTLPASFAPTTGSKIFNQLSASGFVNVGFTRVDVNSDATVVASSHGTNGGTAYLSLEGITYNTN